MSDEVNPELQDQTANQEPESQTQPQATPAQPDPAIQQLRQAYSASSQEALRLYRENQALQAQMQQIQQQASQPPPTDDSADLRSLAKRLQDAALSGNEAETADVMAAFEQRAAKRVFDQFGQQQVYQNQRNAIVGDSLRAIQQYAPRIQQDQNLQEAVSQRYRQLAAAYSSGMHKPYIPSGDVVNLNGEQVNVHLLREAMDDVVGHTPASAPKSGGNPFRAPNIESNTTSRPDSGNGQDYESLLGDRAIIAKRCGMTPKDYWDHMTDDERAALRR